MSGDRDGILRVLVVDDDQDLADGIAALARDAGHDADPVHTAAEALAAADGADAAVVDLHLPDSDGLELVRRLRAARPGLGVVVITGDGSIATAVEAMRLGARAYLVKPFTPDELLLHLREMAQTHRLRAASAGRGRLVGGSRAMQRAYAEIDLAAASTAPVLITGATGTGKELAAEAVHRASALAGGPLISVNCAAIPAGLADSELFGHEPGAFTGAAGRRRGRFPLAEGGTLFLDELDSLPADVQPKLLRALESGEYWPLGAERPGHARVRLMAASNRDLDEAVAEGRLRGDLYWRLNVLRIRMPALDERPEDIPQLVRALLDRIETGARRRARIEAAPDALAALLATRWPGNVRELAGAVARAHARARAEQGDAATLTIHGRHLDPSADAIPAEPFRIARARAVDAWTRSTILAALAACDGSPTAAARRLQMGRTAFLRLVAKLKLRG